LSPNNTEKTRVKELLFWIKHTCLYSIHNFL